MRQRKRLAVRQNYPAGCVIYSGFNTTREIRMEAMEWIRRAALLALSAPLSLPVFAALGDGVEPAGDGQTSMKVAKRAGTQGAYTMHERQTSSGTLVREYAGPDGRVFAVAWQGPAKPDLRRYLGRYFEPYRDAASVSKAGHRNQVVHQPDLVVRSSGHMRAFSGMAYVPSMLPAGVSLEELQ